MISKESDSKRGERSVVAPMSARADFDPSAITRPDPALMRYYTILAILYCARDEMTVLSRDTIGRAPAVSFSFYLKMPHFRSNPSPPEERKL